VHDEFTPSVSAAIGPIARIENQVDPSVIFAQKNGVEVRTHQRMMPSLSGFFVHHGFVVRSTLGPRSQARRR